MPRLTINGAPVTIADGASVLDAVNASGTYLPQLCKDPDMGAIGACRTCLVEVEGQRGFPASCSLPAAEGMSVRTDTEAARNLRKGVLDLTLGMLKGSAEGKDYEALSTASRHHGVDAARYEPRPRQAADASSPFFSIAMDDCIMCGRCAKGCGPGLQFIGAIDVLGAGAGVPHRDLHGPAAARVHLHFMRHVPFRLPHRAIKKKGPVLPVATSTPTTCPYCGVGCGVSLQVSAEGEILEVLDDPENPSSVGMLCVKGRFGTTFVNSPDRLTSPLIKENGAFREASWDEALDLVAEKLVEHRGAFATLCSAKATNEDGYVQQKFAVCSCRLTTSITARACATLLPWRR